MSLANSERGGSGFGPSSRAIHVVSLSCSKIGDGLADAKIVLSWLLGALGAPGWMVAALVPIREAGALLPQIVLAPRIAASPIRKWWWAGGSVVQGIAACGMGIAALLLDGTAAGAAIVGLLAISALARSACSASYKDVLGKTVARGSRGTVTGTAASISAAAVLAFAGLLLGGVVERSVIVVAGALLIAGGLWFLGAALFTRLDEAASAPDAARTAILAQFRHLRRDPQLSAFLLTRACLTATALSPPFLVALAGEDAGFSAGALGPFLLASSLASLVGGRVWGVLSDRSSRAALAAAGLIAAVVLGLAAAMGAALSGQPAIAAGALFVLMLAHQGVRTGRSTHLTDMAPEEHRAAYTAVSNTVIGVALLLVGAAGGVTALLGPRAALALFAALALAGGLAARLLLEDVQSG